MSPEPDRAWSAHGAGVAIVPFQGGSEATNLRLMKTALTARSWSSRFLLLTASVLWLGGLIRVIGEAGARLVSAVAPATAEPRTIVIGMVGAIAFIGSLALIWRWPWYRGVIRQSQQDIRALWGISDEAARPASDTLGRGSASAAVVGVAAFVLAALLPGLVAAAIALVVGLLLRLAGTLIVAAVS